MECPKKQVSNHQSFFGGGSHELRCFLFKFSSSTAVQCTRGVKRLGTCAVECIRTEAVHCQFALASTASGPLVHEMSWNQVEGFTNKLKSEGRVAG